MSVVDPLAGAPHQTHLVAGITKCCDVRCVDKCYKGFDTMSESEIDAYLNS